MNTSQLEKEIIKALEINSRVDWLTVDPNQEFKDLIKFVKQLFKELRKEFNAPKAKIVVATLGQTNKDSATDNERLIIDGMFAFGDSHKKEAAVVYTHPISMGSSSNAHYGGNAKTYMNVGLAMGEAMVKLLKK